MDTHWCLFAFASAAALSLLLHALICLLGQLTRRKQVKNAKKALIVIAHPDDESMFFGPVILGLQQEGCELYLLCLSIGDYYKRGAERKAELHRSCRVLGIKADNITIVQHSDMPDDPKATWSSALVGNIVQKYAECLSVDIIVTFDGSGVSGHVNHISVYSGIVELLKRGAISQDCKLYVVQSVNKLRKYTGMLDTVPSYLMAQYAYVLPWSKVSLVRKALYEHRSQMLWFRHLYSIFSRYMVINTLHEVVIQSRKDD
ncbi:N-acetylglucosaminyl-phosphatidylinositol de-N-acetylase-like [Ornithodoros turicata]|uniref:N-acetylglucosaminyl-phosphatidylinositol de-N-acetylase-like n=1 Tax=Ornithodoros turicata TaxID=34597 RepID=UPI00313A0FA5